MNILEEYNLEAVLKYFWRNAKRH